MISTITHTIRSFQIMYEDTQSVEMPRGAQILGVSEKGGVFHLHTLIDADEGLTETHMIEMHADNAPIRRNVGRYIGTVDFLGWVHVFETGVITKIS